MANNKRIGIALIGILVSVVIAGLVALAGSQHGIRLNGTPLIIYCAVLAFGIQWLAFIPAYLRQTEHFYDLTGSISYILVMLLAFTYGTNSLGTTTDARSVLLLVLVAVWAGRLGSFLFGRIRKAGKDRRFDAIKPKPFRFLLTWTLQGLWVFLTLACALVALTTRQPVALGVFALVGTLVWLAGFAIEVVADRQKSEFNANPANNGRFVNTGLWAWSRHPNYFGEIVLWTGVAIIALPVLQGWQYVALVSPLFVIVLLTRISGVPMLEKRADEKWGGEASYEAYKAATPVLLPKPPGN